MDLFKSGLILQLLLSITFAHLTSGSRRQTNPAASCIENGRFYRNPRQDPAKVWLANECAKYYLCLEGEVFEFKCSVGLLFDVVRQICDFKANVDNCDLVEKPRFPPRPLLSGAHCPDPQELGCSDGNCLPSRFFCDGSVDCFDGSDETWCVWFVLPPTMQQQQLLNLARIMSSNDVYTFSARRNRTKNPDHDPHSAPACDPTKCRLPDCFCSSDGTLVPGNLNPEEVPQMILLTFDDAINSENWNLYTENVFSREKKNANGCPIRGTFYVSHQYTNYHQTQKLWNDGHEIAVHSITHRGPEDWWSQNATIEDWFDEMVGQANILNRFASIRLEELRGIRVPFLRVGWNRQFLMMKEFGFVYDSSIVAPFSNPPLWPYTLDYKIPHKCQEANQICPTRSYPGIWEMVLNPLSSLDYKCAMFESCPPHKSGEDIYDTLHHNLQRHYNTNRAPLGLYFHSSWLKRPEYMEALKRFIDDVAQRPDIWFVTNWQAIQWMRNPTPISQLDHFEPWTCKKDLELQEIACPQPNTCKLYSRMLLGERYFYTCTSCPQQYPWIRNEFGND